MADESLNQTPDDSIASALASAIAHHETPPSGVAATAAEKPPQETKPESSEKEINDGASTSADQAGTEADDAGKADTSETSQGAKETKDTGAKADVTEAPNNWSAKDKETFKKLPPEAQKFLLDRHKAMEGDYVKKTQAIAAFKREYEPVDKIFEPYRDRMKAGGWTPSKLVEAWAGVEKRLMEGDAVNVVAGLVKGYQVDLSQVAQALGLRPRAQTNGHAQPNGEAPPQPREQNGGFQLPPQLAQQLQSIQARLDADDRARADTQRRTQTEREQRVMNEIDQFKSAQDDKGTPLYPHFDEVEEAMTLLAQSAAAARKPIPALKELYETAVWANPKLREDTLAARDRAQQEKAASEARAKAAQARKAGSSVTGAPGPGGQATPARRGERSLREELDEAFSSHQSAGGRI